ncbi:MAG: GMC family oxidoreductase N-terminal domain-containing protein [Myxococcota bacterium]
MRHLRASRAAPHGGAAGAATRSASPSASSLEDGTRLEAGRIVLAGGVLQSPLLLLRSGIGPADELRPHGIEPQVDLPAVGHHWTDHMVVQLSTPIDARWVPRGGPRGLQNLARLSAPDSPGTTTSSSRLARAQRPAPTS